MVSANAAKNTVSGKRASLPIHEERVIRLVAMCGVSTAMDLPIGYYDVKVWVGQPSSVELSSV
jgi:hypothetical protein